MSNDPQGRPPDKVGIALTNHATAITHYRHIKDELDHARRMLDDAERDLHKLGISIQITDTKRERELYG